MSHANQSELRLTKKAIAPYARWGFILVVAMSVGCQAAVPRAVSSRGQPCGELAGTSADMLRQYATLHFTIRYDVADQTARSLAKELKRTYTDVWLFCTHLGLTLHPPEQQLQVLLFDQQDDLRAWVEAVGFAGSDVAGFYWPEKNLTVIGNVLNRPEARQITREIRRLERALNRSRVDASESASDRSESASLRIQLEELRAGRDRLVAMFNRLVLRHEAAHHVLYNIGVHRRGAKHPAWLVEGLACQFEEPVVGSETVLPGVNHARLADLREALRMDDGETTFNAAGYRAALESGRLLPLDELVSADQLATSPAGSAEASYAQAWGLVHYLARERGEALREYIHRQRDRSADLLVTPSQVLRNFTSTFGQTDDRFHRSWLLYILALGASQPVVSD